MPKYQLQMGGYNRCPPRKGDFMHKNYRAANIMNFAHSYDLQLFNDDFEEVVEEVEEVPESEVVETTEEVETESEETEAAEEVETEEVKQEPTKDITQTQAFAKRLSEEKARIEKETVQKAIDAEYDRLYGAEYGIHSKADYDKRMYEQRLQEAGQDPSTLQNLIDEHPDVKAAREARENAKQWNELVSDHPEITKPEQVPLEALELWKTKGVPLLDAYNRVFIKNQKAEVEKLKLQTEQETIRKLNKNATTSPGSATSNTVVHKTKSVDEMTAEEFEAYREEVRKQRKDY